MNKIIIILLIVSVLGIGGFLYIKDRNIANINSIDSFEECAQLYPVMNSYPGACLTPDGKRFTEEIGNELEYSDEILISHPRPNQLITSPLRLEGRARGPWYFEANASAELLDENGNSLGIGIIQAQGEWMTEEFVPFEGKIIFENPPTPTGKLIIKNANPSGMPENDKQVEMPVKFR